VRPDAPDPPELEVLELPELEPLDHLWDPAAVAEVLDRAIEAADQLLAIAYRTPRR
jgi:hypothetical protein